MKTQMIAERLCESHKVCFDTKALALDGAESLMDQGRVNPGCHIMPYRCQDCRKWHVANRRIVFHHDKDEKADTQAHATQENVPARLADHWPQENADQAEPSDKAPDRW